ncbi:MAG: hypothetical protein ACXWKG_15435 [Limisphaerales bacterium]
MRTFVKHQSVPHIMMKSRETFWLAVKIIGFIILLQGFRNCVEGLLVAKGYYNSRLTTPQYWAAWAVIKIIFGVYLMVGGVPFLNLAFPLNAAAASDGNEPSSGGGLARVKEDNGDLFNPKVMFGVAVKIIGLILVLYSLEYFFDALLFAMKTAHSNETTAHTGTVFAISEIVLGLAMLRGAAPLVDFAFPRSTSKSPTAVDETKAP